MKNIKKVLLFVVVAAFLTACKKDSYIVDAVYTDQKVGISQAAVATVGPGANGVFTVTPKIEGQAFRYQIDNAAKKFNVAIAVLRSGVNLDGAIPVDIGVTTDTITKFLALGKLPVGTEILPSSAYTLPTTVTVESGKAVANIDLAVDLNFLLANLTKKYAIAVNLAASKTGVVNPKLSVAVIYINVASVLPPVANFSNYVITLAKSAGFINLSANGVAYTWSYGDGSPIETTTSPTHVYAASGTYSVTLTTTGIAGSGTPSVKTTTITIP